MEEGSINEIEVTLPTDHSLTVSSRLHGPGFKEHVGEIVDTEG